MPLPEGRRYEKGFHRLRRRVNSSFPLKGEVSKHKGIFDEVKPGQNRVSGARHQPFSAAEAGMHVRFTAGGFGSIVTGDGPPPAIGERRSSDRADARTRPSLPSFSHADAPFRVPPRCAASFRDAPEFPPLSACPTAFFRLSVHFSLRNAPCASCSSIATSRAFSAPWRNASGPCPIPPRSFCPNGEERV